jgi:hypothetical protein
LLNVAEVHGEDQGGPAPGVTEVGRDNSLVAGLGGYRPGQGTDGEVAPVDGDPFQAHTGSDGVLPDRHQVAVLNGPLQLVDVDRLALELTVQLALVQTVRRGRAAEQEAGPEVGQHLLPGAGRGVVCLVHDDEVEPIRGELLQFPGKALDRGDDHPGLLTPLAG